MARAEEYRRYAIVCLRVAHQAADAHEKTLLLEMAQRWRELPEKAQQHAYDE